MINKLDKLYSLMSKQEINKDKYEKWEFTEYIKNCIGNDKHLNTPFELSWEITHNCNLKCDYCYTNSGGKIVEKDVTVNDCHKIIEKIHKSRIYDVSLEGGEPFFRKDILEIINHLKEKRISLDILTNGYLINKEICIALQKYLDNRIDNIQISIDSINNKGIPLKLQNIIKMLSDYDINVRFNIVLTIENTRNLKLLYLQLKNINVQGSFSISPIMPIGRAKNIDKPNKADLINSFIELKQIECEQIEIHGIESVIRTFNIYNNLNSTSNSNKVIKKRNCSGGRVKANISSNGNIYPCTFLKYDEFLLGNILNENFYNIWNSPKADSIREMLNVRKCNNCTNNHCSGGCLGLIYSMNNVFNGQDPRCNYKRK